MLFGCGGVEARGSRAPALKGRKQLQILMKHAGTRAYLSFPETVLSSKLFLEPGSMLFLFAFYTRTLLADYWREGGIRFHPFLHANEPMISDRFCSH